MSPTLFPHTEGHNENYLPVWLQQAGYDTYYTGKFLNAHSSMLIPRPTTISRSPEGCPYEEDVNVPMIVRGPQVPRGEKVDFVTSHTDVVPTLFDLASIELREDLDGLPMPLTSLGLAHARKDPRREHVSVEYWGATLGEGDVGSDLAAGTPIIYGNNTYKAMRVIGDRYDLFYSNDPYQMTNLFGKPNVNLLGRSRDQVVSRLDAPLLVLKSCKGSECTLTWATLHPDGKVTTLLGALDPKYNAFYAAQPDIGFAACEAGYLPQLKGRKRAMRISVLEIGVTGLEWRESAGMRVASLGWKIWLKYKLLCSELPHAYTRRHMGWTLILLKLLVTAMPNIFQYRSLWGQMTTRVICGIEAAYS
ncbi:alkaline-phosphatase-like protein [Aspergillus keveii]|uniref:Alkaline-phosphatase-like protein n=1 Tax=Aspergillus keveii TaxID=714993 RepID=A0ABR4FK43_9EURO